MTLDEIMETWRAQEEAPLYGVNRDLLQLVLRHEQADLRRSLWKEQWMVYIISSGLLVGVAVLFALIYHDDDPRTVWDYVAAAIAAGAILSWAGMLWVSRKRQARRERGFGNSLQEEIRRNLSLIDYQLSWAGRRHAALLAAAPITLAGVLLYWLIIQINNNPFGWYDVWMIVFIVATSAWSVTVSSRETERDLLPRKRRLSELLDLLNSSG